MPDLTSTNTARTGAPGSAQPEPAVRTNRPSRKITMLAASGAGKTCYLRAMFARMSLGWEGLTFDLDQDTEQQLLDEYDQMENPSGEDRWPPPTAEEPQRYEFRLRVAHKEVETYEWIDYRGGTLDAKPGESDYDALLDHLMASDGVLVCVSGQQLATIGADMTLARAAKIQSMNRFLRELESRAVAANRPRPGVGIIVTKSDYISDIDALETRLRGLFSSLFAPESDWQTAILPVTLGPELANHEGDPDVPLSPKQIELPLVYAIRCSLAHAVDEANQEANHAAMELNALKRSEAQQSESMKQAAGRGVWGRFGAWWRSDESLADMILKLNRNQQQIEATDRDLGERLEQLQVVKAALRRITTGLRGYSVYVSGRKESIE